MSTSVCVSVCPRAYLLNHSRDLYHILCLMAVARSSSGGVAISREKRQFWEFSSPLYNIAFATYTTKPIEMPFVDDSGGP